MARAATAKSTTSRSGPAKAATSRSNRSSKSAKPLEPSIDDLIGFYRDMLVIRRFEEKAGQLYGMGLIGGFCHLYIGQEAVVVGMQAAIDEGDTVLTSYRDHRHMLACGQIGRAHVRTPVTNAHLVCRHPLEKTKIN